MIESGLIVAVGLCFLFVRLSWRNRLRMLSHPLAIDIAVFIILNWIHAGTAIGVMTAAVAAVMCSFMLTFGRWAFGYMSKGKHVPGKFTVQL